MAIAVISVAENVGLSRIKRLSLVLFNFGGGLESLGIKWRDRVLSLSKTHGQAERDIAKIFSFPRILLLGVGILLLAYSRIF
jgi:hypothetical protein